MASHERPEVTLEAALLVPLSKSRIIPETPYGTQQQLDAETSSPLQSPDARKHELQNLPTNDQNLTASCGVDDPAEQAHPSEQVSNVEAEQQPGDDMENLGPKPSKNASPSLRDCLETSGSNDGSSSEEVVAESVNDSNKVGEKPDGISLTRTRSPAEESKPVEKEELQEVVIESEQSEADKSSTEIPSFLSESMADNVTVSTPLPQAHDTHKTEQPSQTVPTTQPSFSSSPIKLPQSSPTKLPPSSPTKLLQSSPSKQTNPQNPTIITLTDRKNAVLETFTALPSLAAHLPPGTDPSTMDEAALLATATTITQRHIKLLHAYNEIRDVGMGLMGLISDSRGVRIKDVQEEFGIEAKD